MSMLKKKIITTIIVMIIMISLVNPVFAASSSKLGFGSLLNIFPTENKSSGISSLLITLSKGAKSTAKIGLSFLDILLNITTRSDSTNDSTSNSKISSITDSTSSSTSISTTGLISVTKNTVVNTEKNGNNVARMVTKDELKRIINNATITNTGNRRNNLIAQIDTFMYIQNNYNVNAIFAVAVAIQESGAGTSNVAKNKNNWFGIKSNQKAKSYNSASESIKAFGKLISESKYYFQAGNTNISEIGKIYCDSNWVTCIVNNMNSLYKNL